MPKKAAPHGRGKQGADGLTDRERKFAVGRREDPIAPNWKIAQDAGFMGDERKLNERGRLLMKKAAVLAIVHAPDAKLDADVEDEESLKKEMRKLFLRITRAQNADYSDKIRAADKLLATIQGGYVPVSVDVKGKVTMEAIVRAMGGAPDEFALTVPAGALPEPDKGADA